MLRSTFAATAFAVCLLPLSASAAEPVPSSREPVDARAAAPIVGYTYAAGGAPAGTLGATAYGSGLAGNRRATVGGGGTVWGAPIERLTLVGDFSRDVFGNFAPSAAAIVPIVGDRTRGWSLGGLGKFKVDGFATGPNNEMESELEGGVLLSFVRAGFHFDFDAITGFGLGDDGEIDSEARLRAGYDLTSMVRLGIDGQGRYRLNGTSRLPGNRNGDFVLGAQTVVGSGRFFGAFTAGPTTMGIVDGDRTIGFSALLSVGGAT